MSLLELESVSVTYGDAVLALSEVSLAVEDGASVALLGANGAGKTTTLRAAGGLLRYHGGAIRSGQVRFDGRPVRTGEVTALVRAGLAQSLEGRKVFAELTVEENLRVGAYNRRARRDEERTRGAMLELFPRLAERLHGPAGLLSGGEQQMLAIARALMARPRLLLLDEPSLGLAPLVISEIGTALRTINDEGTAILVVDQSTALALQVADYAYLLETGAIRSHGKTAELLADDRVRDSYLGMHSGELPLAKDGRA
ncbi:MAG: ABC transporter ATP-binding protein [Tomitella sp.]|nr:ABC transporter ATP-binding protein [Tomitella sp.]